MLDRNTDPAVEIVAHANDRRADQDGTDDQK
jgi:hypothetical protein